jgi:hypothetical protein
MVLKSAFRFLASTGLAVVLLLLLMLLTFLGTFQQVEQGLYQVQKEYFGSLVLVHRFGGVVPMPLPGAYLLLLLGFVNVTCGGIVRARKGWRQAGILITHAGILLLLAGGFVTFHFALRGQLTLHEGEQSDRFQSYEGWEILVTGPDVSSAPGSLVIPEKEFEHLRGDRSRTFFSKGLPFEITLSGYAANAAPTALTPGEQVNARVVDGTYLKELPPARELDQNLPGVYLTVKEKESGTVHEHILTGDAQAPIPVTVGDRSWAIALERRTFPLPFTVSLDRFVRDLYPGTNIAKEFSSYVAKIEGESRQPLRITMNEPLRHKGYTLYQASWGPVNAGPHDRLFSVLAVVKNPADAVPLYACSVIGFGLLVHFCIKLFSYLRTQHKVRP